KKGNLKSMPSRTVQLAAPLIAKLFDHIESISPYLTPEALANIEYLYGQFYSKTLIDDKYNIRHKLEDHEIFMVRLVELLNARIDSSSTPITEENFDEFIRDIFKNNQDNKEFREKVKEIAQLSFNNEIFINTLISGSGYKDLVNMLIENEDRLKVLNEKNEVHLGLLLDYKPHFKTSEKLSISDLPGRYTRVIVPGTTDEIIDAVYDDRKLQDIIDEFGALVPIHKCNNGKPDELILMPASQLNNLPKFYELGFVDGKGNVHTGYFLCDNEGNKLNSRLKFDSTGVSIRPRSDWARNFYDYDLIYNGNTFIYQSNFFAAYTIRIGKKIHSNIQDTYLNLEHIDPVEQPLPNLKIDVNPRRNSRIITRKDLIPEIDTKSAEFAIVLNQLAGMKTFRQIDIGKIFVTEAFLNLNNKGYLHSIPQFKKILASLKPKSGDLIYGDGSIADPTKSNYWLKHISRGFSDTLGNFIENVFSIKGFPLTIDKFYEAWLNLIKNDLARGTDGYFKDHRGNLESLVFSASEDVYKKIDTALEDVFGYTTFISLLAGIMTFSEDNAHIGEYKIDFWCHNNEKQVKLLNKFVGRSLYDSRRGDLGQQYLDVDDRHYYFASLFLFGAKRGERQIKPSSSFFLDGYFRKHIFLYHRDYKVATNRFIHRSFSEYLGKPKEVQKLNEMNMQGRLEIFIFLAKKLNDALDKITMPYEGYREFCLNLLMQRTIHPISSSTDVVLILRDIFCTGSSNVINIGKASFEVTRDDLIITPSILFTMVFNSYSMRARARDASGYFLDFNLVWGNLAPNIKECYDVLTDILNKAPVEERKLLKVEFFGRTQTGISRIDIKNKYLSTDFSQSEFNINLENKEDVEIKVLSMLFWMMMEPNIIAVVKFPSGDFILNIHDYFEHSDTMSFTSFHNHELSIDDVDMISYVMKKFIEFYKKFLGGDKRSEIFDLR
ncbi:MAG: hypothetical protein ACTSVX_05245, partial [Promethearchaeota archaeon]